MLDLCDAGKYQNANDQASVECSDCTVCVAGKKQTAQCSTTADDGTCGNCEAGQYQTSNTFTGTSCELCTTKCFDMGRIGFFSQNRTVSFIGIVTTNGFD